MPSSLVSGLSQDKFKAAMTCSGLFLNEESNATTNTSCSLDEVELTPHLCYRQSTSCGYAPVAETSLQSTSDRTMFPSPLFPACSSISSLSASRRQRCIPERSSEQYEISTAGIFDDNRAHWDSPATVRDEEEEDEEEKEKAVAKRKERQLSDTSMSKSAPHGCVSTRCVRLFALTLCLLACVGYSESRPINDAEKRYRKLQSKTVKYLAQFGYLKGPSRETQNLRSQEDLTRAIKALQKAGGIPQTGVPDKRTEDLMTRPRCGNTDDFVEDVRPFLGVEEDGEKDPAFNIRKKRFTVATSRWPRTNLTFRFVNYTPDMPQSQTRKLIGDALSVWSETTPLSFREVSDANADIMIMFARNYHSDGYPFDGKGMVLGHAFFPGHGKGGDTHFDDDENWTTNSTDGVDLFMVAAHEFGHALGLAHSGDPSALMYPWYMGFEGKFQLPEDDVRGIVSLYGTGEKDRRLPDRNGVVLIPNSNKPGQTYPPYRPEPTKPTEEGKNKGPADPCRSHIDALTLYRGEVFVFIGKYFWRLDERRTLNGPVDIHQFWYGFPKDLERIDAVFERSDKMLMFFNGDRYWVFNANHLSNGFPTEGRPITEFNIPADVKKIDAAYVWGYNKRTYLVSGDMYWKMNENNTFVEYDYPRDMGTWKGVPVPLDAAFQDVNGKTYFLQNHSFWEFYDIKMQVQKDSPRSLAFDWMKCSNDPQRVEQPSKPYSFPLDDSSQARHVADEDSEDDKSENNHSTLLQPSSVIMCVICLLCKVINQLHN